MIMVIFWEKVAVWSLKALEIDTQSGIHVYFPTMKYSPSYMYMYAFSVTFLQTSDKALNVTQLHEMSRKSTYPELHVGLS